MFPRCSLILAARPLTHGRLLIGAGHRLPWPRLPRDLSLFQRLTLGDSIGGRKNQENVVLMGRKTWDSLPQHPLPGRQNWILSRSHPSGLSWESVRRQARTLPPPTEIWVIGGAEIYNQALRELPIERIVFTEVKPITGDMPHEIYTPEGAPIYIEPESTLCHTLQHSAELLDESEPFQQGDWVCRVKDYRLRRHPEYQYLDLIAHILEQGDRKDDRTGTGTISQWGGMTRWNLARDGFPLFTTKRVFWRGVAEELLWFLRGQTDATILQNKDIHIWDGNASREFLDSLGFTERAEGDLGPVYGFQWRHFGGSYPSGTGGIDQIQQVLQQLREKPFDRRGLVLAWNPQALRDMALPPCHVLFQLQGTRDATTGKMRLNCGFYQRSCDMGLGVPFNVASYALLTHILAHMLGWEAGELVHWMGDCHVYTNHEEALRTQLERHPNPFPQLRIRCEIPKNDPGEYTLDDFELIGYEPQGTIRMPMAV
jgi:dihydrofolate reductase / thymidylate synthase